MHEFMLSLHREPRSGWKVKKVGGIRFEVRSRVILSPDCLAFFEPVNAQTTGPYFLSPMEPVPPLSSGVCTSSPHCLEEGSRTRSLGGLDSGVTSYRSP